MRALRHLRDPIGLPRALARATRALALGGPRGLSRWLSRGQQLGESLDYAAWVEKYDRLDEPQLRTLRRRVHALRTAPLFSLVPEPVESLESLEALLGAVRAQLAPRWELLLSHRPDASPALQQALAQATASDARVAQLGAFADRTVAWNAGIDRARGSHLCLLDTQTTLRPHALLCAAEAIAAAPRIDLLYGDHDLRDAAGARRAPFFKGAFDPELLWSIDALGPFAMLRTNLAQSLRLRGDRAPAERYDLLLRLAQVSLEASGAARIVHLPRVLAHVSREEPSGEAHLRALQQHLDDVAPGLRAGPGATASSRRVRVDVPASWPASRPLISAIIPTRDGLAVLRRCVEGLLEKTDWQPLELLIVDNGSREPQTLRFLEELERSGRARVLRDDGPFNYSALNNRAAREARGELLALLNNDLEMIDPSWLAELAGHALREGIGAVGARLLYPDGRVQHAGVATGVLGVAGHVLRGRARDDAGPHGWSQILRASTAVTAACLVVRRQLFLDVGGFDAAELPVAFNDVDLCLRLAQRGLRNLYVPTAELIHHESWSRGDDLSPEKRERFAREMQTMLLRWPELGRDPRYSPNLSLADEQMQPASPPRTFPNGKVW